MIRPSMASGHKYLRKLQELQVLLNEEVNEKVFEQDSDTEEIQSPESENTEPDSLNVKVISVTTAAAAEIVGIIVRTVVI